MQPRAIETRYKGYRFRSRLEARWAVFFDALGLKWEYEPEGFELPGGVRYLPDFRITHLDLFVEIKPSGGVLTELERGKVEGYVYGSGRPLVVCRGLPGDDRAELYYLRRHLGGEASLTVCPAVPDFRCGRIYTPISDSDEQPEGSAYWFKESSLGMGEDAADAEVLWECAATREAFDAARGARFEHGENGARR